MILNAAIGFENELGNGWTIIGKGSGKECKRIAVKLPTTTAVAVVIERGIDYGTQHTQIGKAVEMLVSAIKAVNGTNSFGAVAFNGNSFMVANDYLKFPDHGSNSTINYFLRCIGWNNQTPQPVPEWKDLPIENATDPSTNANPAGSNEGKKVFFVIDRNGTQEWIQLCK